MKQTSTQRVRVPFKMCLVLLTAFSLMFAKTTKAHTVVYFIPPCITAGQSATIGASITFADANTWYHWQYRVNVAGSAPGAWQWINGVANGAATNTTINGTVFSIQNGNRRSGVANSVVALVIANATTALNNVELRLLMSDNEDPQGASGGIWGGDISAPTEGKGIRLMVKPATESCYANCTNNRLVTDPANPTLDTYWGGFEAAAATNFGATTGTFGASATAQTDLVTATEYSFLNNPYVMNSAYTPFAPHSGKQMLVVTDNDNSQRTWYRTIVVSNSSNYYQNGMSFKAWFSKVQLSNSPTVIIEVKGSTTQSGTANTLIGSQSYTFPAAKAPGDWQQVSLDLNIPVHTYKKLTISIRTTTNNSNFCVDDLCFLEPASGLLPIIMTPLKGTYSNGVSHLTWSTLQESNSSHFDIERSSDGVNFTAIGKVYAKGFSDRSTDYSFNDVKVNAGTNYYRLRAVDKDADFKNSNIVALDVKIKGTNITGMYPNPFFDKVNIAVSSDNNGQAVIRMFDNTGRMIASQQNTINKGVNNITIDNLAKLAKGIYMIKIQIGDDVVTQKLIK